MQHNSHQVPVTFDLGVRTCDLGDVGDGQSLCVVSWSCQTLGHVARLEVQQLVVFVQRLRESEGGEGRV